MSVNMVRYVLKHHRFFKCMILGFMLFLGSLGLVVSYTGECTLDVEVWPPVNSSDCPASGTWGGFLTHSCCEAAFDGYLVALAKRANQTGQIFLNSTEQKNCLISMKAVEDDILSCGIEKLTRGTGGCSEYSTQDVKSELGDELKHLGEECQFVHQGSCGSCLSRWKQTDSVPNEKESPNKEQVDVCRFAVLVSLISSRVMDQTWSGSVRGCLAHQNASSTDEEENSNGGKSFNTGLWAAVGGLVGIFMMLAISLWILLRKRADPKSDKVNDVSDSSLSDESNGLKLSMKEIYAATNNLSSLNYIGEGIAGKVYKGTLSSGQQVAVKHIVNEVHVETFLREVTSLSRIRHPNLVALIGYCEKDDECFLVYELCQRGNLSEWLYGKDKVLSWNRRLEIAVDCARGLWFLHTYPEGCIVHRDIKPTNILLMENFQAKLSDFGLSKVMDLGQSFVSSEVRGTFGYVDPEYQKNHLVNSSGDVYSFGIVLLQILSAQRVINLNLKRPMPLDKMAKLVTRGGNISEFADPKLGGEYTAEAFDMVLKLALSCTGIKQQRPSMGQVVARLEKAHDMSAQDRSEAMSIS
uniref:Protein kinase domain-containing protein n=1 Tax=Kalanchoe fedtschenkoi TaxID=63787 RepID=A0A7N0U0W6_KALFE